MDLATSLHVNSSASAGIKQHIAALTAETIRANECPFSDLPEKRRTWYSLTRDEMQKCQWLKPLLVAQIEFQEWTPDGHLRHPRFAGLRSDKDPQQVVRE